MADGIVTTLLENIQVNLGDTTNYSAIANALGKVVVSSEFEVMAKQARYAVIVPDSPGDVVNSPGSIMSVQPVDIYIVSRREPRITGEKVLLGGAVNGLDTMAKDCRQALCRAEPYAGNKPTGGATYATQAGVLNATYAGMEYMGEEESDEKRVPTVVKVSINYLIVDSL